MLISVIIVLFVILLFVQNKKISEYFTMSRVKSTVDDNDYLVIKSYSDKEQAANLIASVNIFTINFIKTLKDKYLTQDYVENDTVSYDEYIKGKEITIILLERYKPESLQENEPESPDKTSYTTNKGEVISLCLREKLSGMNKFHDLDVLKFVLLHELSHIITPEFNHSVNFWTNFRFLLDFCNKYGLYTAPTYDETANKVNYCGLEITYSPVSDMTLSSFFK